MRSKSDNIEIMVTDRTDEIIKKLKIVGTKMI